MHLLSQLPCPVLVTDPSGRVLAPNAQLLAMVGGAAEDWRNKPMEGMFPPANRIFLQTHVWPMLIRQDQVREISLHLCGPQSERIPVLVNCLRGDFEGVESYFWVFFVALERSRFEAELLEARGQAQRMAAQLAEQHELLHVTLQSIGDAVITTDASGCITWLNPVAESLTGWLSAHAQGLASTQVFHIVDEDTRTSGESPVALCLQQGQSIELTNHTLLISRKGPEFGIEHSADPIRNAQGEILGVVLVFHDVTERRRIAQLKTDFVSTVSHELRTPLTSISGALGLVCGGALGPVTDQAKAMLDIAYKNSQRLTHLINDLLDMEKLVAGKMRFELEDQALMPLVEQAIESTREYAQPLQVTLTLQQRADGVRVRVDASRLQQVLSNFLSNAAKFSPQGAQVEVRVRQDKGRVRVEVVDHGPGITAEFRSRIFQKFSQADSSDTRQKGGSGLGLAISKEMIERMSGVIGFNSEPGQGACFYFELDLCA